MHILDAQKARTTEELDKFMIDFNKRSGKLIMLIAAAEMDSTSKTEVINEAYALEKDVKNRINLERVAIASKNLKTTASKISFRLKGSKREAFDHLIDQAIKVLGYCEDGSFDPDRITLGEA